MSFKKYGGLNQSSKNSIFGNVYLNAASVSVTEAIGQLNSKIICKSHLDMSNNSVINAGSMYFQDGTQQTTALQTGPDGSSNYFPNGIIVNGNGITTNSLLTTTATIDGGLSVAGNASMTDGINVTGPQSTINDLSANDITTNTLNVTGPFSLNKLSLGNAPIGTNTLAVGGSTLLNGALSVSDIATLEGGMNVTGPQSTINDLSANQITVNTLNVTGPITFADITVTGATTLEGGLTVTGTQQTSISDLSVNILYFSDGTYQETANSGGGGGGGSNYFPIGIDVCGNGVTIYSGATNGLRIQNSMNVDISGNIDTSGNCSANSFNVTSDYRIKEDARSLDNSFNVDRLRPVTYTNKHTQKQDIGFIAHEVQDVFPFLVSGEKDQDKYQTLNYIGLIGVLVEEIQTLKKRVSELESNQT